MFKSKKVRLVTHPTAMAIALLTTAMAIALLTLKRLILTSNLLILLRMANGNP